MVCNRCIAAVTQILEVLNLNFTSIQLGEVTLQKEPSEKQITSFRNKLQQAGFELLDDNKRMLIEKIKTTVIEQVHYGYGDDRVNFSDLLASRLYKDYSYLSHLFSQVEGVTIEKYIINQKIEKVKELLVYDELTLTEIAHQTGYSSVAHLSSQFKKVTGLTPTNFRKLGASRRKTLDKV